MCSGVGLRECRGVLLEGLVLYVAPCDLSLEFGALLG